ncbi:MAG: carboxypeptidase-like regulatory domain-containing protein [Acidobacteria bacterium]|nr:carboxypeptidase-like regulatory domain-containing protein [Acidobacteriota bacterium]
MLQWSKTAGLTPRLSRHFSLSLLLILSQILTPISALGFALEDSNLDALNLPDTITGTLIGKVLDANGAGFPGVRIQVTNRDTGNQRATLTNIQGDYKIAFLPLGKYDINATKEGFEIKVPTNQPIKIQLNKPFEVVPDIVMGPLGTTPPVAVATPAPAPTPAPGPPEEATGKLANQTDSTRRANADEQQVSVLPLGNIRSFDDLAFLAAGVAPPPQVKGVAGPGIGPGIGTAGQFSVNGQRARSNNFTVDGSDNNDEDVGVRRQGFVALVPQSIESIKEIQIVTHTWDSEQGRNIGSQVNAVSKSGSNQVHGAVYDFFNHSSLNARNFFDYTSDKAQSYQLTALAYERFLSGSPVNPRALPVITRPNSTASPVPIVQPNPSNGKDQYQRNQGGGVIGFPIIRDKTFFFGSFERQDIKANQETHFAVPTVAQRGFLNFGASGFSASDNQGRQQSFTPTFIAGDAIYTLFPFPNNPIGPYGGNTYTQVLPADAHGTIFSLKLDHSFRLFGPETTHNFTARYNFTDDERQIPAVGGAIFSGVKPNVGTQNLSLFLTSQLSPSLANQLRASYGRTRLVFDEIRDRYLKASDLLPSEKFLLNAPLMFNLSTPQVPLPFVDFRPSATRDSEDQLATVGQVLVYPFSPVGLDVYLFPQSRANNTVQVADALTYFRAQHTLKFGFDLRRTQLNSFLNRNFRPQVVFGGSPDLTGQISGTPIQNISQFGPTPGFFSGTDLAALGIPTGIFQSLALGTPDSTIGLRFWQLNFFVNDNWRAGRGLTLDFGMRYELNTVPHEVNDRIERTFGLDQVPQPDQAFTVAAPFSNGAIRFDSQKLINSFNNTLGALSGTLDGRTDIFRGDNNNFGGHIGFAWDPFAGDSSQAGKTVIRGGGGIYYDVVLGSVVSQSRNVFPSFVPINVDVSTFAYAQSLFFQPGVTGISAIFNPRFVPVELIRQGTLNSMGLIRPGQLNGLNIPTGALPAVLGLLFNPASVGLPPSGGGLAFTLPENNLRSPMAFQYNLQVERELFNDFLVNLAYVGSRGVKLTRFRTPNGGPNSITLPIDPLGLTANPIFALSIPPLSLESGGAGRPNPNLGAYTIFDSSAGSTYHSLQASATKRFSKGFQMSAAYTWSHGIDDVSDVFDLAGAFTLPQDDRNLQLERGSANFDILHRFAFSAIGDMPYVSRFNNAGGAKEVILGNWQFALMASIQTGQPYTVNTSFDINLDGNLTDRIDTLAGLQQVDTRQVKLALTTNPVNLLAPLGDNGSVGRNTFRAMGIARTDLTLIKNFRLKNDQYLVFRAEGFNLFNRTHFAIPVRIIEAPSFGKSVDTLINPRQIQFALKYVF